MFRYFKNVISYLLFVITLDYIHSICTIIDLIILIWSAMNWGDVVSQSSGKILLITIFINFIWQVYNVVRHFSFLKREDPRKPLLSMLNTGENGKKDFSQIQVNRNLTLQAYPYVINTELGVLENPSIVALLKETQTKIYPELSKQKYKVTKTYIKQYQETLLKFLNHRWYEIQQKHGIFSNDKKICLASELYHKNDGRISWRITDGRYYNGFLTNFIYTQYIGGTHYKLYPPMNMNTDPIKELGESDFSDHIGVSTILLTRDNYFYILRQAENTGYNANRFMPTGSGSVDFKDYKKTDDLRQIIIRAAERELSEESSIKRLMGRDNFDGEVHTNVIGYYRDMERGGKPEFCCVSLINMDVNEVSEFIHPNINEIAHNSRIAILFSNTNQWNDEIKPEASLSLKMNYNFLKQYLMK